MKPIMKCMGYVEGSKCDDIGIFKSCEHTKYHVKSTFCLTIMYCPIVKKEVVCYESICDYGFKSAIENILGVK
jgi:hypothetical protein